MHACSSPVATRLAAEWTSCCVMVLWERWRSRTACMTCLLQCGERWMWIGIREQVLKEDDWHERSSSRRSRAVSARLSRAWRGLVSVHDRLVCFRALGVHGMCIQTAGAALSYKCSWTAGQV